MVVEPGTGGRPRYVWEDRDIQDLLAYVERNVSAQKRPHACLAAFAVERGYPLHGVERLWYTRVKHLYRGPEPEDAVEKTLLHAAAKKGGRLSAEDIQKVAEACGVTYARAFSALGHLHLRGEIAVQERANLVAEIAALKEQVDVLKKSLEAALGRLQELEQFRLGLRQLVA